ncbi:uncharacterized protein EV420DRAFT_1149808 [Desarmillaria tabescens]|uniref:Protein kinase domain-containing protein n=1 Tax=Armillaria tabescens TaxID=1929756 RepID=A0AA39NCB1_ARMTA|nr:uncharacterized protein EV420DRAFT_1149808 [Desarmillaria tabescens]KAK0463012.1 hypothetical protein EV420DRAFT_1149808 [Desarmillaria tabescens]
MAVAVFFLDPLLSFYPPQFYPDIAMSTKNELKDSAPPSITGRKTPPQNASRLEQLRSAVQSTPPSNHSQSVDPAANPNYLTTHFDQYIEEDLRNRVFMPADYFFPNIFHLPSDWRTNDEIKSRIQDIKTDPVFQQNVTAYVAVCNRSNPGEKTFYHPHGVMCNSAFDVLGASDDSNLGIYRQDAKPVDGGVQKIIPDTLGILRAMFNSSGNVVDNMIDNGPEHNFSWAQAMHWQEFKPKEYFLDEGTDVRYRVLTPEGEDPQGTVRGKTTVHRDPGGFLPPVKTSTSKKRPSEDNNSRGGSKYARSATAPQVSDARKGLEHPAALSSVREGVAGGDAATDQENETKARRGVRLQCGRYALEMLSSASFRTHCIGALVTVGRIQPLYYDRSIVIVCKPIDMFKYVREPGKAAITTENVTDEFAAMLVGLGRLTLKQRGIQEAFCTDRDLIKNYQEYMNRCEEDKRDIFKDVKLRLKLKLGKDHKEVEVTLGRIIARQPGIVGRDTCVVEAMSAHKGWTGKELIVKISWPAVDRTSEAELVQKARDTARAMKEGAKPDWALDHLPDILLSQDFDYDADSTQAKLVAFFKDALLVEGKKVEYEERVCRITVQEKLYPLEELKTAKEYAQVFFDILQIHKWLYDHPRIIHRDISPGNIMWRCNAKGDLYGVLNDFDLSTLRDATGPSSVQRTGTLPYMAFDLLMNDQNESPPKHLYRHDLESIFCVIFLHCCCHQIVTASTSHEPAILTRVPAPIDDWFKAGRYELRSLKANFWLTGTQPRVNSGFADFLPWVRDLYRQFRLGLLSKAQHDDDPDPAHFDNETLQGRVSYSAVINTCREFAGSSLVVHNDQLKEVL